MEVDISRRIPLTHVVETLRLPSFRLFMVAMLCFTAAMQMQIVAQGWLVFEITRSNLGLAVITSMWSVTIVVFSPLGGVFADRLDRKRLLMLTWSGGAVVFAIIAALIVMGRIELWHLVVMALLNGMFFAFNIPARFSLLSHLVGDARLIGAMALVSITFNLTGVIFPLLGGGMIDLVGPSGAYLLVSFLYLLAVGSINLLPSDKLPSNGEHASVMREMVAGVKYILRDQALRWLWLLALAAVVLGQTFFVLLPGFAADTLGVPASGLGLLMAMVGLGALAGNVLIANLDSRARLGLWMFLLGAASGIALVGLAFATNLASAVVVLFILGLTGLPFFTINQVLIQLLSTPEVRGRVLSLYMLTWAAMPLGTIPLAAVVDRVGLAAPLTFAGGTMFVIMVLVAWLRRPLLRPELGRGEPLEVDDEGGVRS